MNHVVIEPATAEDLDELSDLLGELFSEESDFRPNKEKQLRGLRLIFEQPNRGRVFVLRRDHSIVGMINLLFTISTAEGGFVILLEDLVIHKLFRDHGYGSQLLEYAIDFARKKNFLRITLLTDRPEIKSQAFFRRHGFFESAMIPMRLLEYVSVFVIVLMHEFGHALACRQVGGIANRIVLWPLGGIAFVDPPRRPGAYLWSIAAGPLVNVILLPVLAFVSMMAQASLP